MLTSISFHSNYSGKVSFYYPPSIPSNKRNLNPLHFENSLIASI